MVINKMGAQHLAYGRNCQDCGLEQEKMKLVCDGCLKGAHSEVGAKMYCHLSGLGYSTKQIFKRLVSVLGQSSASIRDYLCFTILRVVETEDAFQVSYCGDGYLILEDLDGHLSFEELSDGECTVHQQQHDLYSQGWKNQRLFLYKVGFQGLCVRCRE